MMRLLWCAFTCAVLAAAMPAAVSYPEAAPTVPQIDESFLRDRIPTAALTAERGTTLPAVQWDRDGDGFVEYTAEWDPEEEEFTSWSHMDPATHQPVWRLEVSDYRESPWKLSWDADGDGLMDFTALDADRDHHPEEIMWQVTSDHPQMARFLDRNEDGQFEARCWIDLTTPGEAGAGRQWAFDDNGDGSYEREATGVQVTENGNLPASAEAVLERDTANEPLRWDMIQWCSAQGDLTGFRRHVLAYVANPRGRRLFRLTLEPMMKRLFYSDLDFRRGVIDGLRPLAEVPTADFSTVWSMAELLRWEAAPPMVHPLLREFWLQEIGLSSDAEIPVEVSVEAAFESDTWFRRALSSEQMTDAARENVAFNLAMLHAAEGDWQTVDELCLALVEQSQQAEGPISAQSLQLADIFFCYGNEPGARRMYDGITAYWQSSPSDPNRAVPNHIALNRLGLLCFADGDLDQARYYLVRALDSLTPEVEKPMTQLATLLAEVDETRNAAEEYLEVAQARLAEAPSGARE